MENNELLKTLLEKELDKSVKLNIDGVYDPYFCYVRNVQQDSATFEYCDHIETHEFKTIMDVITV